MKNLKKELLLLVILIVGLNASAQKFEVDGIYYSILSETDLTCEVTSGDKAYSGSVTIPETAVNQGKTYKVTSIGSYAFKNCSGLTSLTIPNSVTTIGESAFSGCSGLNEVHISDLKTWCNINFKDSYSNPLYYAHNLYLNNKLITDLVIPDGVKEIKNYAFYDCSGLTSVTIPNSVTYIRNSAFEGCSGLTSVTIGNSVTNIGDWAFYKCSSFTSITIPKSVTYIGSSAFESCSGLTSVTIPNSVTSIGDWAFYDCSGLTSVTIGNSVSSIGSWAFSDCSGLTEINSLNPVPPTMVNYNGKLAFDNTHYQNATLNVPKGSIDAYKQAIGWEKFLKIQEKDFSGVEAVPGDVNQDKVVDVADVTSTISIILGTAGPSLSLEAADVNGDGTVDVADVTSVIDIILNGVSAPSSLTSIKEMMPGFTSDNSLEIHRFTLNADENREVPVLMNNPGDSFTSMQFDLCLPEGVEMEDITVSTDRSADGSHHVVRSLPYGNRIRVICYSDCNSDFTGNSGEVLRLQLRGTENMGILNEMTLRNIVLARADGTSCHPSDRKVTIPSGIDTVEKDNTNITFPADIYTVSGQLIRKSAMDIDNLLPGFYIINGEKVVIR